MFWDLPVLEIQNQQWFCWKEVGPWQLCSSVLLCFFFFYMLNWLEWERPDEWRRSACAVVELQTGVCFSLRKAVTQKCLNIQHNVNTTVLDVAAPRPICRIGSNLRHLNMRIVWKEMPQFGFKIRVSVNKVFILWENC